MATLPPYRKPMPGAPDAIPAPAPPPMQRPPVAQPPIDPSGGRGFLPPPRPMPTPMPGPPLQSGPPPVQAQPGPPLQAPGPDQSPGWRRRAHQAEAAPAAQETADAFRAWHQRRHPQAQAVDNMLKSGGY